MCDIAQVKVEEAMEKPEVCHVCHGTGTGIDPVFGYRGKCYPCDGTGKAHECNREWNCYICKNWPKGTLPLPKVTNQ